MIMKSIQSLPFQPTKTLVVLLCIATLCSESPPVKGQSAIHSIGGSAVPAPLPSGSGAPSCIYSLDDGITHTAVGVNSGETAWLQSFHTAEQGASEDRISEVGVAWGCPLCPPALSPNDGYPASIYVWEDPDDDADPTTGPLLLLCEVNTQVRNTATDLVNFIPISPPVVVQGGFFVGASLSHVEHLTPAGGDVTSPIHCGRSWLTGSTTPDGFDPNDVGGNEIGPYEMCTISFPMNWLLRAIGEASSGSVYCVTSTTGVVCPCGNDGVSDLVHGCESSVGLGGSAIPWGSSSVASDGLIIDGSNLPAFQPALLFVGGMQVNQGMGLPLGDGLRCAGTGVVRLGAHTTSADGSSRWGPNLQAGTGVVWLPGDVRFFQIWYRDPTGSPCGSGFNLTNGVEIQFSL